MSRGKPRKRIRLRECCFCVPLKRGCLIIAAVYLAIGVAEMFVYFFGEKLKESGKHDKRTQSVGFNSMKVTLSQERRHLINGILGFVLGLLLLIATLEEAIFFLVFWLWIDVASISIYFIVGVVFAIKEFHRGTPGGLAETVVLVLLLALLVYCVLVVFSYYRYVSLKDELEDREDKEDEEDDEEEEAGEEDKEEVEEEEDV